ncbi:hypothetical protein CRUP_006091, partial [Coryphaenoides rupestris]
MQDSNLAYSSLTCRGQQNLTNRSLAQKFSSISPDLTHLHKI